MKILNVQKQAFVQNLEKAFQGQGVYQDNYKNRKLGRVGQPYKKDMGEEDKTEERFNEMRKLSRQNIASLLDRTDTLKNAKGKRLDAIIAYSNSDGADGIKVKKDATDSEKRLAIADFYADAADFDSNNLDEIVEDAFDDYVPSKNTQTKKKNNGLLNLIRKTDTLKNAEGPRLDAIIAYSNSDGADGIKVKEGASDRQKRIAIAKFYKKAAENDASNLDEIVEDALADYVPNK